MLAHLNKAARQILLFHRFLILLLQLLGGFLAGALHARDFFKADRYSAGAYRSLAMQRHQQRSLQKAQAQHQIDVKGRRERIALIERLWNRAARFAQPRIVQRHAHQPLRAVL